MDYPVIHDGKEIGRCTLEERGLYWEVTCRCAAVSSEVERLYSGQLRLGVLAPEHGGLALRRRISKASAPELPPPGGLFTLAPAAAWEPWTGRVLEYEVPQGLCRCEAEGQMLRFPYEDDGPCPCPPLFCLFSIEDGFWQLRLGSDGKPMVRAI